VEQLPLLDVAANPHAVAGQLVISVSLPVQDIPEAIYAAVPLP